MAIKESPCNNHALSNSSVSQPVEVGYLAHNNLSKFFPSVYFFNKNLLIANANIAGIQF